MSSNGCSRAASTGAVHWKAQPAMIGWPGRKRVEAATANERGSRTPGRGWRQYMTAGVLRRLLSPFSWASMNSARSARETLGTIKVAWMSSPLR
jgi:hypothetical protein